MTFPEGFFDRVDETADREFYAEPRFVTHIDDRAIRAVGVLYQELHIAGRVLDLMSSWVSHFSVPPAELVVLGMNRAELAANPAARARVVHDLNALPTLPFAAAAFDHAVCCVSVDYLVHPVDVFTEVRRVLRPGGIFACTFSNRLFPTKAIRAWLATDSSAHCTLVAEYFKQSGGWAEPTAELRTPVVPEARNAIVPARGDPLYAVWARNDPK